MKKQTMRRLLAGSLVVSGALLLWLAPETMSCALVAAGGIALEVLGIALDHG